MAGGALDDEFFAAQRLDDERAAGLFAAGDWLRATDEFYLYQRMRRWAGTHATVATMRRQSVNAMFDRRFIELALAVAPDDKRDSLLLGRLMSQLDPELAAIPLDIGVALRQLGEQTVRTKVLVASLAGRRLPRKAWQRVTSGRRPQAGAASAAGLLLQHWRATPTVCDPLFEVRSSVPTGCAACSRVRTTHSQLRWRSSSTCSPPSGRAPAKGVEHE